MNLSPAAKDEAFTHPFGLMYGIGVKRVQESKTTTLYFRQGAAEYNFGQALKEEIEAMQNGKLSENSNTGGSIWSWNTEC